MAWSCTDSYNRQLEWYEALTRLKEQGKVRFFGVSANDWDPYGTANLVKSGRVDTIQVIYNIFEQRPAEKLFPAALEHKVDIIVRLPFEEGLLTGKLEPDYVFADKDWRAQWLTPERLREATQRVFRAFLRAWLEISVEPGIRGTLNEGSCQIWVEVGQARIQFVECEGRARRKYGVAYTLVRPI